MNPISRTIIKIVQDKRDLATKLKLHSIFGRPLKTLGNLTYLFMHKNNKFNWLLLSSCINPKPRANKLQSLDERQVYYVTSKNTVCLSLRK